MQEIIRRHKNGERQADLAREFGIPLTSVNYRIVSNLTPKKGYGKISDAQRFQIIAQSEGMGIDKRRIAKRYGVTRARVYQIVGPKRKMPRLTDEEIADIYRLLDSGLSIRASAAATGRSHATVCRLIAKRRKRIPV